MIDALPSPTLAVPSAPTGGLRLTFGSDIATRRAWFVPETMAHPAKLHLGLLAWLVQRYTRPGQVIADPMAGVGSLLLAAAVQREVIVREVEPHWVAIAECNAAHIQTQAGMFAGKVDVGQHDARQPWGYHADHIIVSPPYGNSISARNVTRNRATTLERLRRKHDHFQTERFRELLAAQPMSGALAAEDFCYGESPDQVGHLRGAAYWEAMRPIYQQARSALRLGGVLIVIIKDHIADGERVCIADETVQVCGDVGFRLVERHQRVLTTFALWTRRRKEQGLPVVEEEDVLVLQ